MRLLCIVASVLCYTQTLALAVICALCFVLLAIVLYRPPFQVAAVNYFVLGTTTAALLTNAVLFRAAWSLKDVDQVTSSVYIEQRPFLTFAHPEALDAWAGGIGVALPREQLCKTVSEEHDELVAEVRSPRARAHAETGSFLLQAAASCSVCKLTNGVLSHLQLGSLWLYVVLLGPLWGKLAYDWVHYAFVNPVVARVSLWFKMRAARQQRQKLKEHERLRNQLAELGILK